MPPEDVRAAAGSHEPSDRYDSFWDAIPVDVPPAREAPPAGPRRPARADEARAVALYMERGDV